MHISARFVNIMQICIHRPKRGYETIILIFAHKTHKTGKNQKKNSSSVVISCFSILVPVVGLEPNIRPLKYRLFKPYKRFHKRFQNRQFSANSFLQPLRVFTRPTLSHFRSRYKRTGPGVGKELSPNYIIHAQFSIAFSLRRIQLGNKC